MTTATKKAPAKLTRNPEALPASSEAKLRRSPAKKAAVKKAPTATTAPKPPKTYPQFDQFMTEVLANPEARAAFEDANARENLIAAITTRRIEMGISQGEAAKRAGINQAQVSQAEAGKAMPVHVLLKLSRALGGKLEIRFTR